MVDKRGDRKESIEKTREFLLEFF
ncbi:MAG: hypothetical protein RL023_942, partial [Candidatus Parcubacteria bacterium]